MEPSLALSWPSLPCKLPLCSPTIFLGSISPCDGKLVRLPCCWVCVKS
uniref:Transcriptional corepressor LEUNIG_HOMOLOG isoform X2 n=1 Tax=Rhizophora mucronata TaxID=61149 RepID=A0A2P2JSV9_RHIMU